MTPTHSNSEDRTRGERSGEGSGTALRALRRDERRRRNQNLWGDSVMPSELPPMPDEGMLQRRGEDSILQGGGQR